MRRFLSLFTIILFIVALPVSAALNSYFTAMDSCFNVNLGSGEFDGATQGDWTKGHYGDSDIVGIIGVSTETKDEATEYMRNSTYSISFELVSGTGTADNWTYSSMSDPTLMIPFGLDFVLRYNTAYIDEYGNQQGKQDGLTDTNFGDSGYGYQRLGYNFDGTKQQQIEDIFSVDPGDDWTAFWFDVVLKVPSQDKWESSYSNADDYQAIFRILINRTDNTNLTTKVNEFTIHLNGYYGQSSSSESGGFVIFSVTPSPLATGINLSDIGSSSVSIGSYFYSTSAIKTKSNTDSFSDGDSVISPLKVFVSSSSSITEKGNQFTLRLVDTPFNPAIAVNIPFEIGLKSKYSSESDIKWFTGEDNKETAGSGRGSNGNSIRGYADYNPTRIGYEETVTLSDDGEIFFRLGKLNGQPITDVNDTFVAGTYSANIYIHLFSEL